MGIDMKQENDKEKMSGRETIRICSRTMKLMWESFPRTIISSMLYNMMKALRPYIPLYFSAQLLNELAGARRQEALVKWVFLLLTLTFITGLVTHLLHSWETVHRHISYWEHQSEFYSKKLLEADFAKIADTSTLDKLTQIENNQTFMGYGINQFMIHLEKITVALFQVLGGILLSVSLFTLPLAEQYRGSIKLNAMFAGIAVLIVATVFLPALLGRMERKHVFEWADHGVKMNRVFFAYGFDLYQNKSNALDMRIYRQDLFGDHILGRNCSDFLTSMDVILNKGIRGFCQAGSAMSSYLMMGFIYLYVCLKAWFGAFGAGSVTQYVGAVNSVAKGLAELFKTAAQVRTNAVFLKKIFEFLDIPNEMYQGSLTVEKRSDRDYEVEFRDVSFKYPNASEYALRHVNMKFKVGERLAVVGQNGSGKTTFIKLLCRLYDPTEGQILLNGIDIRKYNYQEYLSIFSVVFQDFQLLAMPVGQNVAAGIAYDAARVKDCLRKAGLGDWLERQENGLETLLYRDGMEARFHIDEAVQGGVEVSGGEEQKIALARSMYRDAPFIILDEPTAALDPVSEYEVYTHFNDIITNCTAIYISHRLSSCRFCDEIAVFHQGSVIEQGSHEELLGQGGQYSELWHAQAQYYK